MVASTFGIFASEDVFAGRDSLIGGKGSREGATDGVDKVDTTGAPKPGGSLIGKLL